MLNSLCNLAETNPNEHLEIIIRAVFIDHLLLAKPCAMPEGRKMEEIGSYSVQRWIRQNHLRTCIMCQTGVVTCYNKMRVWGDKFYFDSKQCIH